MARRRERPEELAFLRDWCTTIIGFLGELGATVEEWHQVISQTYDKRDLRGLRSLARDIGEWAKGLPPSDVRRLDGRLRSAFGEGIVDQRREDLAKIAQVVARGRISDAEEYRLLHGRVEEIYADDAMQQEVESLNALLLAFIEAEAAED